MSSGVCVGSSDARLAATGLTATTICACELASSGIAFTLVRKDGDITAHG